MSTYSIDKRCELVTDAIANSGVPCPEFLMSCVMELHTPEMPFNFVRDPDIFYNLSSNEKLEVILQDYVCYAHVLFYLARILDCDRLLPLKGAFIDLKKLGFKAHEVEYISARSKYLLAQAT